MESWGIQKCNLYSTIKNILNSLVYFTNQCVLDTVLFPSWHPHSYHSQDWNPLPSFCLLPLLLFSHITKPSLCWGLTHLPFPSSTIFSGQSQWIFLWELWSPSLSSQSCVSARLSPWMTSTSVLTIYLTYSAQNSPIFVIAAIFYHSSATQSYDHPQDCHYPELLRPWHF